MPFHMKYLLTICNESIFLYFISNLNIILFIIIYINLYINIKFIEKDIFNIDNSN